MNLLFNRALLKSWVTVQLLFRQLVLTPFLLVGIDLLPIKIFKQWIVYFLWQNFDHRYRHFRFYCFIDINVLVNRNRAVKRFWHILTYLIRIFFFVSFKSFAKVISIHISTTWNPDSADRTVRFIFPHRSPKVHAF